LIFNRFKSSAFLMVAEKRWARIVSVIAACMLFSAIYAAWNGLTPVYVSSCSIKIDEARATDGFINRLLSAPSDNIETQQVIIQSHDFIKRVALQLSLIDSDKPADQMVIEDLRSKIYTEREGKTDILRIKVLDKDPEKAFRIAETVSSTFIASYREAHDKRLDEVIAHIIEEQQTTGDKLKAKEEELEGFMRENRLISIDLEGEALLSKKNEIEGKSGKNDAAIGKELEKVNENIDLHMDKKIEFDRLKMEVESLRNIASFLEEKRQEAMIRKAENPDDARVVSPALRPLRPFNKPDYLKILLTGLIAGIVLGLILTIIIEYIGHSYAFLDKLEKELKTGVIGIIPAIDPKDFPSVSSRRIGAGASSEKSISLITHLEPRTIISESFRGLRANIQAACEGGKIKTIAVTGSYPGEGRTMVSVNLAISLAQAGLRTLLVGVDLINPDLSRRVYLEESPGLTDILLGAYKWKETVKTVTDMIMGGMTFDQLISTPGLDRLNIITSGALPDKQGELLGIKGFAEFLDTVKNFYDVIILDSSPLLSSSDAAILAAKADGTFVVYNPEQVSVRAIKRTLAQLSRVSSNIMGIVLNRVRPGLIPHALREKYEAAQTGGSEVHAPDKKKGFLRGLISLVAIIIIIAVLYWKYDAIFPGRPEIKEVVNSSERDAVFKPQKPDRAEVKRREPELPASNVQEEKPNEKVIAPEPPSPAETEAGLVYQEGRYPYSVYLGSFDSTAQARSALDKYSKAGIDAFWVKVNLGEKGIWYRVYSGEFADKEGAEAFINEKAIKDGEIKKTAYAVYTGSFTDKEALLGMINILKQNDFSPYIISDENYDNLLVGAFLTKAGADELSTELTNLGISNSVVLR